MFTRNCRFLSGLFFVLGCGFINSDVLGHTSAHDTRIPRLVRDKDCVVARVARIGLRPLKYDVTSSDKIAIIIYQKAAGDNGLYQRLPFAKRLVGLCY